MFIIIKEFARKNIWYFTLSCLLSYVNIQIVGYYFQIVFQVILQYLPRKN